MLRLGLLGPPVVELDGRPARFDTRKAIGLLALLATRRSAQSREQLAALFWPESDEERARSSLRRTLSVTAASSGGALVITRLAVSLDESQVECDVWEFERLAAAPRGDLESLAAATALYRGDFLAGFRPGSGPELDDWQLLVAEEQRQRLGRVLAALVAGRIAAGATEPALGDARRWLALDEMHEPAHQAVMRLLAWTGQRSAALSQYRRCVRILDRELGVAPLPATSALYEEILADRLGPPPAPIVSPGPVPAASPDTATPHPVPAVSPDTATPQPATVAPSRPPLVGRERELGELLAVLAGVGPAGRVATVTGPAGSGKTRLVEELRDQVATSGAATVLVRCHDGEREIAFGVVTAMLRSALQGGLGLDPALVDRLTPADRAEVGRLVPELAAQRAELPPPLESPGAQLRFFDALGAALTLALGGRSQGDDGALRRGTLSGLAVVEDAQFLDDASAQLLGYVLRRLDAAPLALVFSWQADAALPAPLRSAIAEAERRGQVGHVIPAPFGVEQIARLLDLYGPPGADPAALLAHTGGLPLLVVAYLDALRSRNARSRAEPSGKGEGHRAEGVAGADRERGAVTETRGEGAGDSEVPATARQLLEERLSAVSPGALQVLTAAAVLGGHCDAELLRLTSGRGAEEVADALDEAVSRGLLAEQASPGRAAAPSYHFPFQALQRVVYDSCGPARRRLLHSRAADVLARRVEAFREAATPAQVSVHLRRAGREEEAAAWSWRAAERSSRLYAHAEALAHLRNALELGAPPADVHPALADALIALGRYGEALVELEQGAASLEPGDHRLVAIEHRLAGVHERLGNFAAAEAHLLLALELAASDPQLVAHVDADRAFLAHRLGRGEALRLAEAALESAGACGDAVALARARNVAGVINAVAGDRTRAEQLLRDSLEVARPLSDPGHAVAALNNLARLLAEDGRGEDALPVAVEAVSLGERHGDVHRLGALHSNLADLLHRLGREEESMAQLKLSAAALASVDAGGEARPEVWSLVEW